MAKNNKMATNINVGKKKKNDQKRHVKKMTQK